MVTAHRLVIYLTPRRVFDLNPLLLSRRGGLTKKRGFASLGFSLLWINNVKVFKRVWRPSFQNLSLPLGKGKGIQGMGLLNNLI